MEANKSITDFISEIKIDRSNLEHIAKTGKINGSLFLEIQDKMRAFASQELLCAIPDYESNKKDSEANKTAEELRKGFCKIKGWNFIEFEDSAEVQEYCLFLESHTSTLQKELDETKQKLQESERENKELNEIWKNRFPDCSCNIHEKRYCPQHSDGPDC